MTLGLIAAGLLCSFTPGAADPLEYDRDAVHDGQVWRPLTAQLVHWTPRMALADLGAILLLGAWLESRSRKVLIAALASAAALIAAGLCLLASDLDRYRGSSGLATALFTAVALLLAIDHRLSWRWRSLALLALLLLAAKMIWEMCRGIALAAGPLPPGVEVIPAVHLLGAIAGLAAALLYGGSTADRQLM